MSFSYSITGPKKDEVVLINDRTKHHAITQLVQKGYTKDFWQVLIRDDPDLATRLAAGKIQFDRERAIKELEESLRLHADDESYWQDFFQRNPWILQSAFAAPVFMLAGETYLGGKKSVGRQGVGGVATDFLFKDDSTKSFAVVEIKTPDAGLVGSPYRGRRETGYDNETYVPHSDLSGAMVQVRNQISVAVEHFQSALGETFDVNRVHPKGVLVIGTASKLVQRQKDSFNHFRHALHNINVITFDELLRRLQLMFMSGQEHEVLDRAPQQHEQSGRGGSTRKDPPF